MSIITDRVVPGTYTEITASMQADPEARHTRGVASESSSGRFPIEAARCATYPTRMEWVPGRERRIVPELMSALCRRCPSRQACLLWALAEDADGYWAGTTRADRARMRDLEQVDVGTADQLQELARQERAAGMLHPPGEGSYWWYRRRGCRCGECKGANAAARAHERARAHAAA